MNNRPLFLTLAILASVATSRLCHPQSSGKGGMSLKASERVARLILKDETYEGQEIVVHQEQSDPNFFGFQLIQSTSDAGNFEFTTLDINKFTGSMWLVVGFDCSRYTSPAVKKYQEAAKINLSSDKKYYARLDSLRPSLCSDDAVAPPK
jgi:hypothetical protein